MASVLAAILQRPACLRTGRDLGAGQLLRAGRVGCPGQQLQVVRGVEVVERGHRGREVLQQLSPQPLCHRGPLPDQRLVRAGQHLDRLGRRAVPGRRAQLVRIGAHHIGQHVRVPAVALGPRHAMPAAVPGRLQRVHREHPVPRGDQRRHPRPAAGLDPDLNLHVRALFWQEPADQLMQLPDPGHAFRHPPADQHIPGPVHHLDVVMILRPVIPCQQTHASSRARCRFRSAASGRTISRLMNSAHARWRARHPSDLLSRTPAGARSWAQGLQRPVR